MTKRDAWHPDQLGSFDDRTIVVTGANSGIGLEVARDLVGRGAHVVMAVRDTEAGEHAAAQLTGPGSTSVVELDLADLDQVATCTEALLDRNRAVSALVCNAGVMGGPRLLTRDGHERQMATNHLGHAALIAGLWPLLETSAARIVMVASSEARAGVLSPRMTRDDVFDPDPYDGRQAYRNSKQANLLHARELQRRCTVAGSPVSVVAVHPGIAATNLLARQLHRAARHRLARLSTALTKMVLPSAAAGARSTLRALDGRTPGGAFVRPRGRGAFRGSPELGDVYPSAADGRTATRLWELTQHELAALRSDRVREESLGRGVLRRVGGHRGQREAFDPSRVDTGAS